LRIDEEENEFILLETEEGIELDLLDEWRKERKNAYEN